jgi:hypothetical protein
MKKIVFKKETAPGTAIQHLRVDDHLNFLPGQEFVSIGGDVVRKEDVERAIHPEQEINPFMDYRTIFSKSTVTTTTQPVQLKRVYEGDIVDPNQINQLVDAIEALQKMSISAVAVVKCQHCGSWAARYTSCKHCGAPVD